LKAGRQDGTLTSIRRRNGALGAMGTTRYLRRVYNVGPLIVGSEVYTLDVTIAGDLISRSLDTPHRALRQIGNVAQGGFQRRLIMVVNRPEDRTHRQAIRQRKW